MKTKLLINGKRYSVNLAGAKYLFNWNPGGTPDTPAVPDTPVVPDVPTYKLQMIEHTLIAHESTCEYTPDTGYDGISEISLTSEWAYSERNMERTYNGNAYDYGFVLNDATIDIVGQTTPIIEIFSNDTIYGGTWKLIHIGEWESWVPDNLGLSDSTYNSFSQFFKFVKVDQLTGGDTAEAYFGFDPSRGYAVCIAVHNVALFGLMDYTYGDSSTNTLYNMFYPSQTKIKITYQK